MLGVRIHILSVWTYILRVWTYILDVWTYILGVWTYILVVWTYVLGVWTYILGAELILWVSELILWVSELKLWVSDVTFVIILEVSDNFKSGIIIEDLFISDSQQNIYAEDQVIAQEVCHQKATCGNLNSCQMGISQPV